ncbi:MAG: 3-deoxy-8-phosphooctulonate synthase [Planctomycetota bacterium]|nr:3-deoxy-8-phosphooctulonate synthase [Planctomycetota bacterium]
MPERTARIGGLLLGSNRLFLIAGPCVIESEDLCRRVAEHLKEATERLDIPYIFKASYDKANRTSGKSYRGPGREEGLTILARLRNDLGVPVLSDVHTVAEAETAGAVLDCLQVPAFLCRQTDLVQAAGRFGKAVNLKKGQFLAPWDMKNVVDKAAEAGAKNILVTERGSAFGYNRLVADMTALPDLAALGHPVVFDATHSAQQPGGLGIATGGSREMAALLARAAVAAGADGLFLEVHPQPDQALSDGPNSLALKDVERLLETCLAIRSAVRT